MDRPRQATFYFIAAALFAFVCVSQAGRHGVGSKALIAGLVAAGLAWLGVKAKRQEEPGEDDPR